MKITGGKDFAPVLVVVENSDLVKELGADVLGKLFVTVVNLLLLCELLTIEDSLLFTVGFVTGIEDLVTDVDSVTEDKENWLDDSVDGEEKTVCESFFVKKFEGLSGFTFILGEDFGDNPFWLICDCEFNFKPKLKFCLVWPAPLHLIWDKNLFPMDDVAELEIGKRSDDVVDVPTIKQQIIAFKTICKCFYLLQKIKIYDWMGENKYINKINIEYLHQRY